MTLTILAVLGFAVSLDLLIGEPPNTLHPVAWFGRVVGLVDREWTSDERRLRWIGVVVAVVLPLSAAVLVGAIVGGILDVQPMAGAVAAALVLFLTTSLRRLLDLTREVIDATDVGGVGENEIGAGVEMGVETETRTETETKGDLETARTLVRGLVGRDTEGLSAPQLRSAAVESAGENFSDGLIAPLLPFVVLAPVSLPLAAAAATWVKAVNTLDSMLGYRSKPIGTASARLDDAVMWVPARISAGLLALAALDPGSLARANEWARVPSSPNAGWPMATLACALSVRLEKRDAYVLNPDASLPTVDDGARAIRIVGLAAVLAFALSTVLTVYSPAVAIVEFGRGTELEELGADAVALGIGIGIGIESGIEPRIQNWILALEVVRP
ncbi:CobD/CbiB family cobalamin biosynthesis protein [Natronoglomus mannanivorans]|uniref:Probable cobalamin biosynthesis protein CobD n=1 Tax=Natronoglomus mannanivorans TaxID=2979990 RepID=A0AAP2Z044_9EURY|nr:cobalamin biosynthesis protein [Halobacteria archaeon AArc-xg1-1]